MPATATIQLSGLSRQAMAALARKAKRLGFTPERYLQELVEEDLESDRKVRSTTLLQIMGPGRQVDEVELDRLVDEARTRHHRQAIGKR